MATSVQLFKWTKFGFGVFERVSSTDRTDSRIEGNKIYIYIYYIEGSSVHESVATIDKRRGEGKDKVDESIKPMNILFSREFVRVCVKTPRRIHVHTLYISSLD